MEIPVGLDDEVLSDYLPDLHSIDPLERIEELNLRKSVKQLLAGITAREAKVIRMRFGIEMLDEYTLEEIGEKFQLTRERIRQIEAKALRKLRHPSRSEQLRAFLDIDRYESSGRASIVAATKSHQKPNVHARIPNADSASVIATNESDVDDNLQLDDLARSEGYKDHNHKQLVEKIPPVLMDELIRMEERISFLKEISNYPQLNNILYSQELILKKAIMNGYLCAYPGLADFLGL
jgi:DNA-binding CsgD family transcriptional regulator